MTEFIKRINDEFILLKQQFIIICFSIFYFTYIISTVSRNIAYYRHQQIKPLRDLGFEIIPQISEIYISEFFLYAIIFLFIPIILTPFVRNTDLSNINNKIYFINITVRILKITIILRTLRSISYISTSLPSTAEHCLIDSTTYNPPDKNEIFTKFNSLFNKNCGDMLFSGHYSFILTLSLIMTKYVPKLYKNKTFFYIFITILWLIVIIYAYIIIAVRNHYTVDIIIAIYTTILVWEVYEKYFPNDPQIENQIQDEQNTLPIV